MFLLIVGCRMVASVPVGLPTYGLVVALLACAVAVDRAVIVLRRHPEGLQEGYRRRLFQTMAAVDVTIVMTAVHLSGGIDAPGLAFVVIPIAVYGCLLSRVHAWVLALGAVIVLVAIVMEQRADSLAPADPLSLGMVWNRARESGLIRLLAVCGSMGFVTYLTTFVGGQLRCRDVALRGLAEARERSRESRERFMETMSHDIRAPLAVIRIAGEILQRYGSRLDEAQRLERFDKIDTAVAQMLHLLDDVMTLERAGFGAMPCERQRLDVVELCRTVVAELEVTRTATHDLVVTSEASRLEADVDPRLLREVVRRLVGNALKYSPDGGRVMVEVGAAASGVVLRVRDEGIGIPFEDQVRLLEAFARGGNVGSIPGSGLGLAIIRKAVELHGGTLRFESRPGVGSVFEVTLAVTEGVAS